MGLPDGFDEHPPAPPPSPVAGAFSTGGVVEALKWEALATEAHEAFYLFSLTTRCPYFDDDAAKLRAACTTNPFLNCTPVLCSRRVSTARTLLVVSVLATHQSPIACDKERQTVDITTRLYFQDPELYVACERTSNRNPASPGQHWMHLGAKFRKSSVNNATHKGTMARVLTREDSLIRHMNQTEAVAERARSGGRPDHPQTLCETQVTGPKILGEFEEVLLLLLSSGQPPNTVTTYGYLLFDNNVVALWCFIWGQCYVFTVDEARPPCNVRAWHCK